MGTAPLPLRRTLPLLLAAAVAAAPILARADTNWTMRVRAVADYLLSQQTPTGCIPDLPDSLRANEDARMEYALLCLVHAYRVMPRSRYEEGLSKGVAWLATVMERREGPWVGSFRQAYAAKPPHVGLPTPPAEGAVDGRGSTAASALFVYLVYQQYLATGDVNEMLGLRPHVRAALDFLLDHNQGKNYLFHTGWYRARPTADWKLYRLQRATDQAAAYLGLRAGHHLLPRRRYDMAADRLAREIDRLYDERRRAFGVALDPGGKLIPPAEDRESYLAQGYLAWVFGPQRETRDGIQWLENRHAPDGTFRRKHTDPPY
ncbi:MAG: hypothetical protein ACOC8D_02455, partial [bacterium]